MSGGENLLQARKSKPRKRLADEAWTVDFEVYNIRQ